METSDNKILYDKYCRELYSKDKLIEMLRKGQDTVQIDIPDNNIKGLELEFYLSRPSLSPNDCIKEESKGKYFKKLSMRLCDGEPYYMYYSGFLTLGDFEILEIADKIFRINNSLQKGEYLLQLERIEDRKMRVPYYAIKAFSVAGEIFERK